MNRPRFVPLIALAFVLSACGGSGPPNPPPTGDLFKEANAWTGGTPQGAETITSAEFQQGVASGDLVLMSDATLAEQAAARQQQFVQNRAALQALPTKSPYIVALLAEASGIQNVGGDRSATLPGGQVVVLNGLGTRLRQAVEAQQQASSAANALADYTRSYELLPPALQGRSPSPDVLKGRSTPQIREALSGMNTLLGGVAHLDRTRLDTATPLQAQAALVPGNGADNNAPCNAPAGLVASFWYPLKNFISPIKDQGKRGTCWAFAATAALDSREAVQNGALTNLSEQFLVNKVKQDWDKDNYVDGYWSEKALNLATDKGQAMLTEGGWTYNRSPNRPAYTSGDSDSYANSCNAYTGTCSNSSHQSREACTTVVFTFCAYKGVRFDGPGVHANHTIQAWKSGDSFDLARYRALLANGHALLTDFTVYRGFMDDAASGKGYVTNYADKQLDKDGKEIAGSYGGHAVLIVGFIENSQISGNPLLQTVPSAAGGGYFIVKNSWGCNTADAGYWYVPVEYVKQYFGRLSYLDFDARRSDAWIREQATPGGAAAITVNTNPARADLRVKIDVAQWFRVSQPAVASVSLTVTSDRGETLYNGNWNVGGGTFAQNLYYTFSTAGSRTLTLVARTGTTESRASLVVNVVNTAPLITLQNSGAPHQGEAYPITAVITDINEQGAGKLCANTSWSVDAPDTLSASTGCTQTVVFGTTGTRQIRISTHDSEGASDAKTLTLDVQPPLANPYPTIISYGVYARDFHGSGFSLGCYDTPVASGTTIDLRDQGCSFSGATPPRFSGAVEVSNPSGETLTYDWKLYVTYLDPNTNTYKDVLLHAASASPSATFGLYNVHNAGLGTDTCRVTVQVNAPDPSRSKGLTVWTGRCTYYTYQLN